MGRRRAPLRSADRAVRRTWLGPRQPAGVWREVGLVSLLALGLSVVITWPTVLQLRSAVPQNLLDPLYFVWQLGWVGHALITPGAHLWTTNAFLASPGNLAYTDATLGYAPLAFFLRSMNDAIMLYNLLLLANYALAFVGGYLLARTLGSERLGSLVCAAAFAFPPWRINHEQHINVISVGAVALALALLARGHGWRLRAGLPPPSGNAPVLVLLGWATATWQLSLGFAIGLPFAWILLLIAAVAGLHWALRSQRAWRWPLVVANLVGGGAFALAAGALARPYLQVTARFPTAERTIGMLKFHSPPVRGLLSAPAESLVWGPLQYGLRVGMDSPTEQTLLPGFVVLALAGAGVLLSRWAPSARAALLAAITVLCLLALGTHGPRGGHAAFLILFRHVPGWNSVRTSGRLILWVSLGLGLLAAGFVSWLVDLARSSEPAPRRSWRPVLLRLPAVLLVAICVEGLGDPAHPRVPQPPVRLADYPAPTLVLPVSRPGDYLVMAWSVDGWPTLANGGSGFDPPPQILLRQAVAAFPDRASVSFLRASGVRTVILLPAEAGGTPWAGAIDKPTSGLGLHLVRHGDAAIYEIDQERGSFRSG